MFKIISPVKLLMSFLGVLFLLLVFASPVLPMDSLYSFREFSVKIEKFSPSMNPYASVEINLDGNCVYQKKLKSASVELEKTKDFTVTAKQLEYLYYHIMRVRFFDIGKNIGNPNMSEGTVIRITVIVDSHQHTVTMYDERYLPVDQVANTALSLMPKELRDDFNSSALDFSEIKLP